MLLPNFLWLMVTSVAVLAKEVTSLSDATHCNHKASFQWRSTQLCYVSNYYSQIPLQLLHVPYAMFLSKKPRPNCTVKLCVIFRLDGQSTIFCSCSQRDKQVQSLDYNPHSYCMRGMIFLKTNTKGVNISIISFKTIVPLVRQFDKRPGWME